MSMLSFQTDRLRDRADELRMLASGMDAPYIVPETKKTMALAMQSAASEMREAADTIDRLRAFQSVSVSPSAMDLLREKLREANETIVYLQDRLQELRDVGGGECEVEETEWLSYGGEGCDTYRHTLSCGHVSETFDEEPPSFCCECGARIRKAVQR